MDACHWIRAMCFSYRCSTELRCCGTVNCGCFILSIYKHYTSLDRAQRDESNGTKISISLKIELRGSENKATRYHNTSSPTSMLNNLGWETLEARRTKAQLTMFFKIANNFVDIPADAYLRRAWTSTRSQHRLKYRVPSTSL